MSCSDCPSIVVQLVADQVRHTLDRVRTLRRLTEAFNVILAEIAGSVQDDLSSLANLVPTPPVLDIDTIIGTLLCPLTPLAVEALLLPSMLDGSLAAAVGGMSGEDMWRMARDMQRRSCSRVTADYEEKLQDLRSSETVRLIRAYVQQVLRIMGDSAAFALDYPIALRTCALVRALCPSIYADPALPFTALVTEVTDWSFDGLVTSDVDPRARQNVAFVAAAEAKMAAWRTVQNSNT